jgi:hypothetical protein
MSIWHSSQVYIHLKWFTLTSTEREKKMTLIKIEGHMHKEKKEHVFCLFTDICGQSVHLLEQLKLWLCKENFQLCVWRAAWSKWCITMPFFSSDRQIDKCNDDGEIAPYDYIYLLNRKGFFVYPSFRDGIMRRTDWCLSLSLFLSEHEQKRKIL